MHSEAYLSECRKFRYWLTRVWDESLPMMCVIGLNPSTADENIDDPTIRKCIGFARRLGFGKLLMLNVGAYRATNPRDWLKTEDMFGPENSVEHLREYVLQHSTNHTPTIIAAWGRNCAKYLPMVRALEIAASFTDLRCWGRNIDRTPRHPLMLPYATKLELY